MNYDKLVRDKIPETIRQEGKIPLTHVADEKEYWKKLKEKLREETDEFLENSNEEELSDILEVIESICKFKGFDKKQLEEIRKKKAEDMGGFKNKIILDKVE